VSKALAMLRRIPLVVKTAKLFRTITVSRTFTTTRYTMSDQKPITAYEASKNLPKQTQNLPGTDENMNPTAEHAKQEYWDENGKPYLKEYQGTGKLENKKVIITGGDSGIGRSVAVFFCARGRRYHYCLLA